MNFIIDPKTTDGNRNLDLFPRCDKKTWWCSLQMPDWHESRVEAIVTSEGDKNLVWQNISKTFSWYYIKRSKKKNGNTFFKGSLVYRIQSYLKVKKLKSSMLNFSASWLLVTFLHYNIYFSGPGPHTIYYTSLSFFGLYLPTTQKKQFPNSSHCSSNCLYLFNIFFQDKKLQHKRDSFFMRNGNGCFH